MSNDEKITLFGDVLIAAREYVGITQKQLSVRTNYSQTAISLIESNDRNLTEKFAEELAKATIGSTEKWLDIYKKTKNGSEKPAKYFINILHNKNFLDSSRKGLGLSRLVNFEILDLFLNRDPDQFFGIENFNPDFIQPTSYDCRVGYMSDSDVPLTEPVVIPKHDYVQVKTKEHFEMPEWIEAEIHAASTIANKPLDVKHGPIIDPSYQGYLLVTVSNHTNEDQILHLDEPFLTIRFSVLHQVPMQNEDLKRRYDINSEKFPVNQH